MAHVFSIFCKSYAKDVKRVVRLAQSLDQYNKDAIPFYVSCPHGDLGLFKDQLSPFPVELMADEKILEISSSHIQSFEKSMEDFPPHLLQQLIKSEFWRLKISENYLIIDSDSYFIKPFYLNDFMADQHIPYTVIHESKDLLCFAARRGENKILEDYCEIRRKFQTIFQRKGKLFDFGPTPVIWSSKVWEGLHETYALDKGTNIVDMLKAFPCELLWYGEYLLHSQALPLVPIEPLFKVYHYREQFEEGQMLGDNEDVLGNNYFGVVMQSNWNRSLDSRQKVSTGFLNRVKGLIKR